MCSLRSNPMKITPALKTAATKNRQSRLSKSVGFRLSSGNYVSVRNRSPPLNRSDMGHVALRATEMYN